MPIFGRRRELPTVRSSLAQDIDRAAKPIFEGELPRTWPRQDGSGGQDYGLDYLVEIMESHAPVGVRFAVQLKGVEKPRVVSNAIHFSFPTKNLGTYVETEQLPVFLVVADVTNGGAWFLFLQRHAEEHLVEDEWAEQQTVTVKVPLENRVSDHERLRRAAFEARDYMLALRTSPTMALSWRRRMLELLDPRLIVRASATEEGELYEIQPREPVRFSVDFSGLDAERRGLLRRGYSVPVTHGEVVFHGMPLFEHLAASLSAIQLASKVACTATIEVERDGVVASVVNVPAKVTTSLDELRIAAAYANAPFSVKAVLSFGESSGGREARGTVTVTQIMDRRWLGRPVRDLPHFDRLRAVAAVTSKAFRVRILLHAPGAEDFEIPWGGPLPCAKDFDEYVRALETLRMAREVSRLLGVNPKLTESALAEGLGNVELLHNLLTVGEHEGDASRAEFKGSLPIRNEYTDRLAASKGKPIDFEANVTGPGCIWSLVGQEVDVPVSRLTISKAKCSAKVRPDGSVRVSAKGTRGSRFYARRASPEELEAARAEGYLPRDNAEAARDAK